MLYSLPLNLILDIKKVIKTSIALNCNILTQKEGEC